VDDSALILYPFVDDKTATAAALSKASWIEFGAMVRQLHIMELENEQSKDIRRETYEPEWGPTVVRVDGYIQSRAFTGLAQQQLALLCGTRRDEILSMLDRVQTWGKDVRQLSTCVRSLILDEIETRPVEMCYTVKCGSISLYRGRTGMVLSGDRERRVRQ